MSALTASHVSEKPWRVGAVVRLAISVFICIMMGGAVAMVLRYFETPQSSSGVWFIASTAGACVCFASAVFVLMRPWQSEERYLNRLIVLLSCIYVGILFMWLAGRMIKGEMELQNPGLNMLIALLSFQGAAVVLVHFFLREHQTGWLEGFGLNHRPAHAMLIGICVGVLALYPAWGLQELSIRLFRMLTFHPHEQQAVEILRHTGGLFERVALGFGTIFIAPAGEELLFRGILYPTIKRSYGRQIALWSTAILFGAIHANLASFLPLMLLAVVLVWLYEYTGNLLAPIAVHCVFNAANFVALYSQQN